MHVCSLPISQAEVLNKCQPVSFPQMAFLAVQAQIHLFHIGREQQFRSQQAISGRQRYGLGIGSPE